MAWLAWLAAARSAAFGAPAAVAEGGADSPDDELGGDTAPGRDETGAACSAWLATACSAAFGAPAPAAIGGGWVPGRDPGADELGGPVGAGEVLPGGWEAGVDVLGCELGTRVLGCELGADVLGRGCGAGVACSA